MLIKEDSMRIQKATVRGVEKWDDASVYYSQENNPTEAYNRARKELGDDCVLETCGPSAAVNCLAAMGCRITITCPGLYKPQPESVVMDYMNDPRNEAKLYKVRDLSGYTIPKNRVPQYYPVAIQDIFSIPGDFYWGASWDDIVRALDQKKAVQICLKDPSHFVAVVAYSTKGLGFLVYNDSWGSRFADGKGGHNRQLFKGELETNVKPYRIVYGFDK